MDIDTDSDGDWWMSPMWIGIGVVALVAVIALIAAIARGGGTVVKGRAARQDRSWSSSCGGLALAR